MELHKVSNGTQSGFVLLDQHMKLVQPVNEYLDYQALRGRATNTLRAYARDLKIYFEFLEKRELCYDQIDLRLIQDYVEHLRSPDDRVIFLNVESKRSPITINRMIGTVHGFYCYQAAMNGIINPLITKEINSPNSVFRGMLYHAGKSNYTKQSIFKIKESDYRIHLFTAAEIHAMLMALPTARDKLIFKFLIQSGARISEVLALKIEDIPVPDFSSEISVLHHVKSKGRYRDIYIPTPQLAELDEYIMESRSSVNTDHSYIFTTQHPHQQSKPISYRGLYEVFKRAGKKAGIDFKFHDTRHTFVTRLVESGMDFSVVRILAGHKHITTTQKYVTLSTGYVAESLAKYWASSMMTGGGSSE
ncbi:MAG: site-specific integrase [Eubacteriales bacterium]|nr:site-specific integrase [Eubacteriales bacterium]